MLLNAAYEKAEKDALRQDLSAKEEIIADLERKVAQLSTSAEVTRERETRVRGEKLCGVMWCGVVRYRSVFSSIIASLPCHRLALGPHQAWLIFPGSTSTANLSGT